MGTKEVRIINFKKTNIESNVYKYVSALLLKNKFIVTAMFLDVVLILILPFALRFYRGNILLNSMHDFSLFYVGIPFILLMLFCGFSAFVLFVKTKNNNVNLSLSILPVSNRKILLIKQITMLKFSFHIILAEVAASVILMMLGMDISDSIIIFLIILSSFILMSMVWIIIFSFVSLHLNFSASILSIMGIVFIFLFGSIIPIIAQKSYVINKEFNSYKFKHNIVKVNSIDDNGRSIDQAYAIYENPSAQMEQKIDTWSPNNFIKFSPFLSVFGLSLNFTGKIDSWDYSDDKLILMDNKYSSGYTKIKLGQFDEIQNYKNIILSSINEKTIFDFKDKSSLFSEIDNQLLDNDLISSKINDNDFWKVLKKELIYQGIWNTKLSKTNKLIISHITGLDKNKSMLYSIFRNYYLFHLRYLDGIDQFLTTKYSKDFSDFIIYLWKNHNVKTNIYSFHRLGDVNEIEKFHPSISSYNENGEANKYDIEYIKNIFFKSSTDSMGHFRLKVLDKNNKYINIDSGKIKNIFGVNTINSKSTLSDYIDKNSTINNLIDLNQKLITNLSQDVYKMSFRDNIKNNLIIKNRVKVVKMQKNPFNWFYICAMVLTTIFIFKSSVKKVTKGDIR